MRETQPRPRPAGADRVDLRALQRAHRPARQPRRGRAARPPRHLPQRRSSRSGRCRTPRPATATRRHGQSLINVTNGKLIRLLVDDEPFDVRYGDARRATSACSTCAPGVLRREVELALAGRARRCESARPGWCRSSQRAVAAIAYEVEPVDGTARIVVQSELVANEPLPAATDDPRAAAALERRWSSEHAQRDDLRVDARSPHHAQRPADGRGAWTTSSTAPDACSRPPIGARPTSAPGHGRAPSSQPGEKLRRREAARLRLVERGARCRRCATRSRPRSRGASTPAGTACVAGAARVPRRLLGRAPTSRSTATPALQQAVRFALFHVLQAGARAEQRRDPRQGPHRPRLRRARVLGHRDLRRCRC